ncbi:hypothetical protein [Moraxella nonliquefaciens]|uniref:hypothetical protein n=1 Tax=Moraxella nonliquefaciens TaxID=478 RepID=UPI0012E93DC0|nr:hypothetical protein [Moraxella nonliquefaciens]
MSNCNIVKNPNPTRTCLVGAGFMAIRSIARWMIGGEYLSKDDGTSLDGIGLTLTTKQMYEQVFIK